MPTHAPAPIQQYYQQTEKSAAVSSPLVTQAMFKQYEFIETIATKPHCMTLEKGFLTTPTNKQPGGSCNNDPLPQHVIRVQTASWHRHVAMILHCNLISSTGAVVVRLASQNYSSDEFELAARRNRKRGKKQNKTCIVFNHAQDLAIHQL